MSAAKPPKVKPGEEPDEIIDLDAARAARREGRKAVPPIRFMGKLWPLPPELPAETVHAFGRLMAGDVSGIEDGMSALFGESWGAMLQEAKEAGDPLSWEDEYFVLEQAMSAFGMDLGESPASADS